MAALLSLLVAAFYVAPCPKLIVVTPLRGVAQCVRLARVLASADLTGVEVHVVALAPEETPRFLRGRTEALAARLFKDAVAALPSSPDDVHFHVLYGVGEDSSVEVLKSAQAYLQNSGPLPALLLCRSGEEVLAFSVEGSADVVLHWLSRGRA
jgi:hypothetical protein